MKTSATTVLDTYFDDEVLAKAREDVRRKKVLTAVWDEGGVLSGRVTGSNSQPHSCTVVFDDGLSEILDTNCTCIEEYDCRHVAALALSYLENPTLVAVAPTPSVEEQSGYSSRNGTRETSTAISRKQRSNARILGDNEDVFSMSLLDAIRSVAPSQKIPEKWSEPKADVERMFKQIRSTVSMHKVLTELDLDIDKRILYILADGDFEGKPSLEIINVNIKKDGSYGADRPVVTGVDFDFTASPDDLTIKQTWSMLKYGEISVPLLQRTTSDDLSQFFKTMIDRALATGRCHLKSKHGTLLKSGPQLRGELFWESVEGVKGSSKLRLALRAIGENGEAHKCLRWYYPWYVNEKTGECGPVHIDLPVATLSSVFSMRAIDKEETVSVNLLLAELGLVGTIPMPPTDSEKVVVKVVKRKPKLATTLLTTQKACNCDTTGSSKGKNRHRAQHEKEILRALLLSFPPKFITDKVYKDSLGRTVIEAQDRSADAGLVSNIENYGFTDMTEQVTTTADNEYFFMPDDRLVWADFDADTLDELREFGYDISKETERDLRPVAISDSGIEFKVKDESSWWYSMELNIDVHGKKVPLLPILRSAIDRLPSISSEHIETLNRKGKFMFSLEDGTVAWMPFERIRTMLMALQDLLGESTGKELRISALHAAQLLDDRGFEKSRWIGADNLMKFRNNISAFKNVSSVKATSDFNATLRPYQEQGLGWLQLIARNGLGGVLADDMGLGKTVQVLAHLCLEKNAGRLTAPALVVCPTSVVPNWATEIEKFAPQLKTIIFTGQNRNASIRLFGDTDIVITSYGVISRDVAKLKEFAWSGVILDEAQAIKNPTARITSAVKELKADYRLCLTGTPVENHLGELWSEFDFLVGGLLGDKATFARHIRTPIEKGGNLDRQIALAGRIRPFLLRRTKSQVLSDLPDKTVIVKQIELSGQQRDLYETVRVACAEQIHAEIASKGFNKSQIVILDALLKLRQACCDPRILNLPAAQSVEESAKLETLIDMIEQLSSEGRKILVFSQFTSMLDLIADDLTRKEISFVQLRGDTRDRVTPVRDFQETDVPVFLLSLKAGGVGLNLTAADVVVHYDPWWNPAAEDQATDRAYRIGQTKNVFVYKLIAYGTIEQRLLEMQDRKRALASSIYAEGGNAVSGFSEDDLANLLKPITAL